jgi:hypothetical protein
MNKFKVSIGDWSEDGHNIYEEINLQSNYTVFEMQEAYKRSCRTIGVQFHEGDDYTGLSLNDYFKNRETDYESRLICCEFEDSSISDLSKKLLNENGIDTSKFERNTNCDNFLELIMKFITFSMPDDFIYEEAAVKRSDKIEPLNGWWNKNLNVGFGYGIFTN